MGRKEGRKKGRKRERKKKPACPRERGRVHRGTYVGDRPPAAAQPAKVLPGEGRQLGPRCHKAPQILLFKFSPVRSLFTTPFGKSGANRGLPKFATSGALPEWLGVHPKVV